MATKTQSESPVSPDRKEIAADLFAGLEDIKGINKLRQIYLTDKREERCVKAFRDIIFKQEFPKNRLPAAYKIAGQEASVPGSSYLWGQTRNDIENFIEKRKADDPAYLLGIIRDPECGANLCASCLRVLFWHQYPDTQEDNEALRDEAVRVYIDNIPAYRPGPEGKEYCIRQLALAIPENYHERYGIKVSHHTYEDEDQFGRNTATATEITFRRETILYR